MAEIHGAYTMLALAKQGKLPDGRSRLGKAIRAIQKRIAEHFGGELNHLQEIEMFNLTPLLCFLLQHPATTQSGKLSEDWKWCFTRVENALRVLCELGSKKPPAKVPTIEEIINEHNRCDK